MKALALALIVCTLIVCATLRGPEALQEHHARQMAEREMAIKEREIEVTIVFVAPEERPRGLQVEP